MHRLPSIVHRRALTAAVAAVAAILLAGPVLAHGVRTAIDHTHAVTVTVTTDDGRPLAFADCRVSPPGDAFPFLAGKTDLHGRVTFVPDRPGAWTVRVDSPDGHGAVVDVPVTDDLVTAPGAGGRAAGGGRARDVVTGVAVVFGVFGLLSLFLRRR